MFGFFSKEKRQQRAIDKFIWAVYGNPPPARRADVGQAIEMANELLLGVVDAEEVRRQAMALNDSPIPYSTHDLGLSVALSFFKQPEHAPRLFGAQLLARLQMMEWIEEGLVAPMLVESFESALYKIYKPGS